MRSRDDSSRLPLFRASFSCSVQTVKMEAINVEQRAVGKVMLTFFFDHKGPLVIEFLASGNTVNAARYAETLESVRASIKSKRPGRLTTGVTLLHDNASPHTANIVQGCLSKFR